MDITDVRVKLINDAKERLKAVCTVTFDGEFVVRDIKVVEGDDGFFVAMPSRKLTGRCPKCGHKNQLRARHCEDCGTRLPSQEIPADSVGRTRLYRDTAHPITPAFREKLQAHVVEAYHKACDEHVEEQQAEEEQVVEEGGEREPVERATAEDTPADEGPAVNTGVEAGEPLSAGAREDDDVAEDSDEQDREPEGQTAGSGIEEYNSLIASLKGGSGRSTSSGHRSERRDRDRGGAGEGSGRERGRSGGRGRRGGRGDDRSRSSEDRAVKASSESTVDREADTKKESGRDRPAVVKEKAKEESKEAPASRPPESAAKPIEPAVEAEPAFAEGLDDAVSVSKVAEEKPVTEDVGDAGDVNDDSAPFGTGLL